MAQAQDDVAYAGHLQTMDRPIEVAISDCWSSRILFATRYSGRHERIANYLEGLEWLRSRSFRVHGITCGGLRGLFHELRTYKVQMCQFHQIIIVCRYLTNNPELPTARELLDICHTMTRTDKESLSEYLNDGMASGKTSSMNGRRTRIREKPSYRHKRIRSAYLSLKRNIPWLWTFQDYPLLHIPNTNNALKGVFIDIKTKLRVHSDIIKDKRIALIQEYIARHY